MVIFDNRPTFITRKKTGQWQPKRKVTAANIWSPQVGRWVNVHEPIKQKGSRGIVIAQPAPTRTGRFRLQRPSSPVAADPEPAAVPGPSRSETQGDGAGPPDQTAGALPGPSQIKTRDDGSSQPVFRKDQTATGRPRMRAMLSLPNPATKLRRGVPAPTGVAAAIRRAYHYQARPLPTRSPVASTAFTPVTPAIGQHDLEGPDFFSTATLYTHASPPSYDQSRDTFDITQNDALDEDEAEDLPDIEKLLPRTVCPKRLLSW